MMLRDDVAQSTDTECRLEEPILKYSLQYIPTVAWNLIFNYRVVACQVVISKYLVPFFH